MDKGIITESLKNLKQNSPKRNFKQSIDLVVNLKDFDVKKNSVNAFVTLPFNIGKKIKVCALVGPELKEQGKNCDNVITDDQFEKYDKKAARKLAQEYDYFIAQATIMTKIATAFGKVFGPKGKMPNPKAGCVVPPNANLKVLQERLQKVVKIQTKNDPIIHVRIGNQDMKEEEVTDNVAAVYEQLIHNTPNGEHNIRNLFLKYTMGPAFLIGSKKTEEQVEKKPKKPKKEEPKQEE